jgi:hypothetical protein
MSKSYFLAGFGIVCLIASLSALALGKPSSSPVRSEPGRFRVVGAADNNEPFFVKCDTETGQTWILEPHVGTWDKLK